MKQYYFNTAATGIVPSSFGALASEIYQKLSYNPADYSFELVQTLIPETRQNIARFLHCKDECVALLPNTAIAVTKLVPQLKNKVNRVLLYRDDYPSLNIPFINQGFEISYIDDKEKFYIDLEEIEEIIQRDSIELLAISDVQFLSGFTIDVKQLSEICKRNDCLLFVDATQSLGLLNWELDNVDLDFLVASSYKFMQGGFGSAILYIKEKHIESLASKGPSIESMKTFDNGWEPVTNIKSFEHGHPNFVSIAMLNESLKLRFDKGLENVNHLSFLEMSSCLHALEEYNIDIIGDYSMKNRAGIICIPMTKDQFGKLISAGISATYRRKLCRISIHYYNKMDEINWLTQSLKNILV